MAYLRWVANEEAFARNVNDLAEEGTGKLLELTIRWGDYDWAISCGESDFAWRKTDSDASQIPHYHFQMRVKKQAFVRYNDFHIPFNNHDILMIEARKEAPDLIKHNFTGGTGMSDIFREEISRRSGPPRKEAALRTKLHSTWIQS
jgi:hypothetical protein